MVLFHLFGNMWLAYGAGQKRRRGRAGPSIPGRQSGSYGAIELHPTASELPVNLVEYFVNAEAAS
jgi:hypothetical protein